MSIKALAIALDDMKLTDLIAMLTFQCGIAGKSIESELSREELELVVRQTGIRARILGRDEDPPTG